MKVRPYTAADAPRATLLLAESAARDPTMEALSEAEWIAFTARGFNRGARDFAIGEMGDAAVGLLMSTRLETTDPPLRHFRILVHPDHRRRGIGAALFRVAETQDEPGSVILQSNLPDDWTEGRRFLERRGFCPARRHLEMERRGRMTAPSGPPGDVSVRPYAGEEADVAAWRQLNAAGYAGDPDFQDLMRDDIRVLASAEGFGFWLAEDASGTVGFVHVTGRAGRGRIESVVVAPHARGRGTGRLLMMTALEGLAERGIDRAELGVVADNASAIGLYRSLGFEKVGGMTTWRRP